jgi:hypothetical protein
MSSSSVCIAWGLLIRTRVALTASYWSVDEVGSQTPGRLRPRDLSLRYTLLGGYPKNSDNYPNTSGVLNTLKYTVRAQRDCDALCK